MAYHITIYCAFLQITENVTLRDTFSYMHSMLSINFIHAITSKNWNYLYFQVSLSSHSISCVRSYRPLVVLPTSSAGLVGCRSFFCETWSLILREDYRLRVFENWILRRMFGLKRDENGECRSLHNEGLHSQYRSPNIVRVIKSRKFRWSGHV